MSWIHSIKWDKDGLVPVIAQDYRTNKVLMFAWMNQEALELTQKNKKAFYWSRSRKKIWEKGEESGHLQNVHEIRLDCDGDVILLKIEQIENIACHTGRETCFYQKLDDKGIWVTDYPVTKEPKDIYKK
jgi:phosphoribosyl-AMP cyclohydrolase